MRYTLVIVLLVTCPLFAVESNFSTQFQNRFGPYSPIYNEPLYFFTGKKAKKAIPKKSNYRERIKRKIAAKSSKSRSAHLIPSINK